MQLNTCVHFFVQYSHSRCPLQSSRISRAYTYLGFHDHHVSNGTCHESSDMAYQCVAKEVMKTPIAKNSTIAMTSSKQFSPHYLLQSPTNNERRHHLIGSSLEIVMDKFSALTFPNSHDFVFWSKRFVLSWMGTRWCSKSIQLQNTSMVASS